MTFKYSENVSEIFKDVKVFKPESFFDYRGEMWTFWEESMDTPQEKISKYSRSRKHVLRGLHGDDVTTKHISCIYGECYLVVVDNRPDSKTYREWDSFIINDKNHLSVLVPPGYLNGHLVLSEEAIFHYTQAYPKNYIDLEEQKSAKWNDEMLNIDWPVKNPILNWRDK